MPTPTGEGSIEVGLLDPVTAGVDGIDDAAFLACLVTAEVALTRAWADIGVAPPTAPSGLERVFRWNGPGRTCDVGMVASGFDVVTGGNPVIPLIPRMKDAVSADVALWVHRGATSQDIMDSALMLLARTTGNGLLRTTDEVIERLDSLARAHARTVTVARTLTQHGVPTTVGARIAGWRRGLVRARGRLAGILQELPAQLGGAGGTLAATAEIGGVDAATRLPAAFAAQLDLRAPEAPWHTVRWPVTELGEALTQLISALGVFAGDVATLSRTEIGELNDGGGGGSSSMPQKSNPTRAILIRSAAIRAPHLAATLQTAAALAVDERPDGAWHAEWPTLRDLLRLAVGAAGLARGLVTDLHVNTAAVARNLDLTGGLVLAERLSIVLTPVIGAAAVRDIIARAGDEGLAAVLAADPRVRDAGVDVPSLLDPANYLGLAPDFSTDEETHD